MICTWDPLIRWMVFARTRFARAGGYRRGRDG
jgi:hypothetical protein